MEDTFKFLASTGFWSFAGTIGSSYGLGIAAIFLWWSVGVVSSIYWWTKDHDLTLRAAVWFAGSSLLFGPFMAYLGYIMHRVDTGSLQPIVLIRKRS